MSRDEAELTYTAARHGVTEVMPPADTAPLLLLSRLAERTPWGLGVLREVLGRHGAYAIEIDANGVCVAVGGTRAHAGLVGLDLAEIEETIEDPMIPACLDSALWDRPTRQQRDGRVYHATPLKRGDEIDGALLVVF